MPKKQSIVWRAAKAAARGSWWLAKAGARGARNSGSFLIQAIAKKRKQKELEQQPHYKAQAVFEPFIVHASGDFSSTEQRLLTQSMIALIFGKRGSGKSALGFRLLENIQSRTKRKCYVLGVSKELLPHWISSVESLDAVENRSAILVDEGAIAFGSRESMNQKNRKLGKLMAIARHKDITLIFITQNTGMLDKNVLKLADALLIKEGSLLQLEMERPELRKFYDRASTAFTSLQGDKKPFVYIIESDFEGVVAAPLPSFWHGSLSKSQATE